MIKFIKLDLKFASFVAPYYVSYSQQGVGKQFTWF